MLPDTDLGGPHAAFPNTQLSAVRAAGSADEAARRPACERIIRAYWKPLYKYIRLKWRCDAERAKDLTQGFFSDVIERGLIARFDSTRSAFRTYLRTCADGFVSNEMKAAGRIKRGGHVAVLPLDFGTAEGEISAAEQIASQDGAADPAAAFDHEWLRSLMEQSVDALRMYCHRRGWAGHFALFEQYDLCDEPQRESTTYQLLGERHGLSESQVTNRLFAVRREFRRILLEQLRDICGSDEEFRDEARRWLGSEPH
ncbi:MAG: sigma-70 family RNA polymerase sigma factor [Phycisphaerales bacterium]|nr:sigma-70 family RNA polymerase sigma factor [Phycisphaerales bacterium]